MNAAAQYDRYMGRWSRLVAEKFVTWLAPPAQQRWLDVGCGTGALSSAIVELASPGHVSGIDPDREYIARASAGAKAQCAFRTGDVASLARFRTPAFDFAVSGLALNQFPDPGAGLRHMARATRAGGTIAAYVWDFAEGMRLFRVVWDAAASLDPAARALDPGRVYAICRPTPLRKIFRQCGLRDVRCRALSATMHFESFDEFWRPLQEGHGRNGAYVTSLSGDQRRSLRDRLREALPVRADGSIRLEAKAWAIRGTVAKAAQNSSSGDPEARREPLRRRRAGSQSVRRH